MSKKRELNDTKISFPQKMYDTAQLVRILYKYTARWYETIIDPKYKT